MLGQSMVAGLATGLIESTDLLRSVSPTPVCPLLILVSAPGVPVVADTFPLAVLPVSGTIRF